MGADAFKDIMSSERYQGNIESIEWIVKLFDNFFVQIVSIVGFFIISLALSRIAAGFITKRNNITAMCGQKKTARNLDRILRIG